jgi:hypothetical protein
MNHAEPLSQRHPVRMPLTPGQHFHIAAAYDRAAFDISLPAHTRAAFAKKADWFRLLARVGEKKERAALAKEKAYEIESNPKHSWWSSSQASSPRGWADA